MKYLVFFLFTCNAFAAPSVENRIPRPDEIGYQPLDTVPASFNPPSFAWLHEKSAVNYTLEWSTNEHFHNSITVSNLQFNTYTHNSPLPEAEYFWRYQYVTGKGELSNWGQTRRFLVNTSAIKFPLPSKSERRALIPKGHPRLFVRPEELPSLRELAKGREAERFKSIQSAADRILQRTLTPEPDKLGSARDKKNLEMIQYWWPNRTQALQACTEAETLAFVYLITREEKYGTAARDSIVALAKWNPDGPTNFKLNCEAAKPMLHRISRAYDWAHDVLSATDRELVRTAITRRIKDAWESGEVGRGVEHINRPFSSHANRTWHKIGESGIVFLDEIPEAEMWLDYALNKYYACYPVWSDSDGGWHEGGAYLGGYMSKTVWWLQAAQSALNLDPLKKPFFSQIGDFPLYVASPHSPNMGFGDLSYQTTVRGWGGFMDYFTRVASANPKSNAAQWRWWGEQWGTSPQTGVLGFLYAATLPEMAEAQAPTNLPPSKVFHGIGVASLHSTILNSSNDVHFLFKSSPFGSQSHGHNPQNAFQLNAYGDTLLPANNYRDLHGTEFHYKWVHQTVSQNGVLVNGEGQRPHSALSRGKIIDSKLTAEWDYVVGDALEAYEGRLERALRHVVFVKPDIIVIYDDLVASEPSDFQFMLHGLAEFKVDSSSAELHIQQPNAGATIRYLGSSPVTLRQWDGYPFDTIRRTFPNQWHVEASTTKKEKAVRMFTVIAPHKGTEAPALAVERAQTRSSDGLKVTVNGRTTIISFPKTEASGAGNAILESPVQVKILQSSARK
ncbi:MAG: DUF4962 domain-containing protein [Verrucomicrobia bacterium]|nr:DUF4962 domain-containing protein [Verrucomicrobiota bacterium]